MESLVSSEIESETEKPERRMSQPDYRPTPYVKSEWEVVGERVKEQWFVSMELEVIPNENQAFDPMFQSFDIPGSSVQGNASWKSPGDESPLTDPSESEESSFIDEEMLEQIRAEAFEAGKEEGIIEGRKGLEEKVIESYEALAKQLHEITDGLKAHVHESTKELEKRALGFALDVAKKIVETTAEAKPEYILPVIRQGLQSLGAGKPLRVRVSPQDYEFLDIIGLPPDLNAEELAIVYVSDDKIKSGCVVETDFGEINLELEPMWEEIKESLFSAIE